jgi:predicted dehydrogenase
MQDPLDHTHTALSRRQFVRAAALAGGAVALDSPFIRSIRAGEPGANDKIRVGIIGCGKQGARDLEFFLNNPEVECPVICDLDAEHVTAGLKVCAAKDRKVPATEKDFRRVLDRRDIDAVIVATPDHWHALPTVLACEAGKDVYVEKPLAKTIDEGRAMVIAARKYNRIVQMGSQWRSCNHIVEAAEFVKSGKLGKVSMVRAWAWLDWQPNMGRPADENPPAGIDYNLWLGPAPSRPFNKNRFHYNFRWFWDYAGGLMTDWGVHLLNMALMGMSPESPKTVCSSGGIYVQDDMRETPDSQLAVYEFPNFMLVWEHKSGMGVGLNGRSWGVSWSGLEGTIFLNDQGYEVVTEKREANLDNVRVKPSGSPHPQHVRNFLDCVKSRQRPVLDAEAGHHVSCVAHLGNIAYRTGQKLTWDPVKEEVTSDKAADKLVGVEYRRPWKLPFAPRRPLSI